MNQSFKATIAAALLSFGASIASAVPVDFNDGTPDLFDAYNVVTGDNRVGNASIEEFRIYEKLFQLNTSGAPLIGLTAAHTNQLGWYDPIAGAGSADFSGDTPGTSGFGLTGDNTAADPFDAVSLGTAPLMPATIGLALRSTETGYPAIDFFSQDGLNPDGMNHFVAYELGQLSVWVDDGMGGATQVSYTNAVLVGFEDKLFNPNTGLVGDGDYDDSIYLIDATPVPLPAAGFLLLVGIGGLAAMRKTRTS